MGALSRVSVARKLEDTKLVDVESAFCFQKVLLFLLRPWMLLLLFAN